MSYQSKYTLEEAKIAREVGFLGQKINQARTKETKEKYKKIKDELIKQLNGKYGSGRQKLPDKYRNHIFINMIKIPIFKKAQFLWDAGLIRLNRVGEKKLWFDTGENYQYSTTFDIMTKEMTCTCLQHSITEKLCSHKILIYRYLMYKKGKVDLL